MLNLKSLDKSLEQLKIATAIYGIIFFAQIIVLKISPVIILKGMGVSYLMVALSLVVKNSVTRPNLPGFAWATLISFALTLPISPIAGDIVGTVGKLNFGATGTPLLAFAGISVGDQLPLFRKIGWKLILISLIVMASTYFGSALIAHFVLKSRGII